MFTRLNQAHVLSKAARVAYAFKTIVTIDVEGVGLVDVMVHIEPGMTTLKVLSPGEEAWSVMKEHSESAQQISRLQSALFSGDRVEQVRLYRECVLEPIRAAQRLQAALDSYDPTLQAEAMIWATQDMLGFSPSILAPRSIHRLAKEA